MNEYAKVEQIRKTLIAVANWLCGSLEGIASDAADLSLAEQLDSWLRLQAKNNQVLYIGTLTCVSCGNAWESLVLSSENADQQCPYCKTIHKVTVKTRNSDSCSPIKKGVVEEIQTETEEIVSRIETISRALENIVEES